MQATGVVTSGATGVDFGQAGIGADRGVLGQGAEKFRGFLGIAEGQGAQAGVVEGVVGEGILRILLGHLAKGGEGLAMVFFLVVGLSDLKRKGGSQGAVRKTAKDLGEFRAGLRAGEFLGTEAGLDAGSHGLGNER